MTKKEFFISAAKRIANGTSAFACYAITDHGHWEMPLHDIHEMTIAHDKFIRTFNPENGSVRWFGPTTPENQLARSLALLLMAEMEEEK